jgi:hypothetical protein
VPPPPPRRESRAGKSHQFLWTASQPIQLCDKGTVRQSATRNRAESSQVRGQFRVPKPMQLPRGLWLLLYNQDAAQCSGGSTPPKGPARKAGRVKNTVRRGAGESGKARKTS